MKKFLAIFLTLLLCLSAFAACGKKSDGSVNDTGSESDSDTRNAVEDSDSENNGNGDEQIPDVEPEEEGAKLVGYCTKASLYDGEFNSTVGWKAAGMGYIIKTKTGNLIVVDGGNTEDADDFYALLRKYSDGNEIVIDYWI